MNIRALVAGISAAAVMGASGLVLTSTVASAQSKSQTIKFNEVTLKGVSYAKYRTGSSGSVYNSSGKLIGFEVTDSAYNLLKRQTTYTEIIDLDSSVIYATRTSTILGKTTGKVTGGTGSYSHATGTITTAPNGSKTAVTIVLTK
jgi:hypothetical protein